jgi:uncharacterized membrane protein YhaH (DUF805 family)
VSAGHDGPVVVVALAGMACFVAGVMILVRPTDDKNRRGCHVMIAVLLLLCAFGLGVCSAFLREFG